MSTKYEKKDKNLTPDCQARQAVRQIEACLEAERDPRKHIATHRVNLPL